MRALAFVLVAACATLALAGCPERSSATDGGSGVPKTCTKIGQTCELRPGKLGSCVSMDECAAPPCLVCQSQH